MQGTNSAPSNIANPVADLVQKQLEASRQLADAIFAGTEKFDRVLIDATHRAFNEQMRFVETFARGPGNSAGMPTSSVAGTDGPFGAQQELMRIMTEMQGDIGRSIQQYMTQMSSTAAATAASAGATGSAGNSGAHAAARPFQTAQNQFAGATGNPMASMASMAPMAGMLSVWDSILSQMATLASRNMNAARSSLESAATNAAGVVNAATGQAEEQEAAGHERKPSGRRK